MRCAKPARCLLLVFLALANPALAAPTNERAIDPSTSRAKFRIQHIFVDAVTGTVPIVSGSVELPAGAVIPVNVTATLDAASIHSGDPDRDSSLESSDYFDIKKYPTWTFVSTKITPTGPAAFGMDGTLTIHGIAQPEHLEVTVNGDAANPAYRAAAHIDRHAFGMKGARLDPVIGNDAEVTLDINLKMI